MYVCIYGYLQVSIEASGIKINTVLAYELFE